MMPGMKAADIIPTPPATALTYDQSAQLTTDGTFRGRVKIACLHFAKYISNEAPNVASHNSRYRWAQSCIQNPDMTAQNIQPNVVMQDQVQAQGTNITDADLQTATETALQAML